MATLTLRREDGRIVCERVVVADRAHRRMRGLLGRKIPASGRRHGASPRLEHPHRIHALPDRRDLPRCRSGRHSRRARGRSVADGVVSRRARGRRDGSRRESSTRPRGGRPRRLGIAQRGGRARRAHERDVRRRARRAARTRSRREPRSALPASSRAFCSAAAISRSRS